MISSHIQAKNLDSFKKTHQSAVFERVFKEPLLPGWEYNFVLNSRETSLLF